MKTRVLFVFLLIFSLGMHSCTPASGYSSPPPTTSVSQSYPTRPTLKRLDNGHYTVIKDWDVSVLGRTFLVQKGYTSNGITAPQSLKTMMGDHVDAPETWCAMFHDWCFTQNYLTREQCDTYFIQLMRDFRIPKHKIKLMGTVVRGYTIYKNVDEAKEQ